MHCGSNEVENNLADLNIKLYCPQKYHQANECCQVHDKCYEEKKGRELCDEQFCNCTKTQMREGACRLLADQSCLLVKLYGQLAYDRAGRK